MVSQLCRCLGWVVLAVLLLPNLPLCCSWSSVLFPGAFQSRAGGSLWEEEMEVQQPLLCSLCPWGAPAVYQTTEEVWCFN